MRSLGRYVIFLLCLASAGCNSVNYLTPERYEKGLVLVLDGAGGITAAPQQICRGLDDGGVRCALEVFRWSAGHNVLADQQDLARNREIGGKLAACVLNYMADHPDRPVHLIGLSAGTGIVVFALEQLPPDCQVAGVCLLASSLNSNYDLTAALSHVRYQIVNFSSVADVMILGVGVGLAGTVDRGQGASAGIGGFSLPKDAPEAQKMLYEAKLVEMPWNPLYMIYGHLGDHLGATNPAFVKQFMAPIILDPDWRQHAGRKPPKTSQAAGAPGRGGRPPKSLETKGAASRGEKPKNLDARDGGAQAARPKRPLSSSRRAAGEENDDFAH